MTVLEKVACLFSAKKMSGTFIVLSPTKSLRNEAKIVCSLFEQGLEWYHLRKPRWTAERVQSWIKSIPKAYRSRIVLHQFPELVEKFSLGGFHVQAGTDFPECVPATKISVQCREYADLEKLGNRYSVLLGPIFPRDDRDLTTPTRTWQEFAAILAYWRKHGGNNKIYAFGGISEQNIKICKKAGFDGIAVVGAVWESARTPTEAFRQLSQKW